MPGLAQILTREIKASPIKNSFNNYFNFSKKVPMESSKYIDVILTLNKNRAVINVIKPFWDDLL